MPNTKGLCIRRRSSNPSPSRLFCDAGVGPGQRVLDIGSGVGDVAMLAARLTGPTGEWWAVERDATTLALAQSRVDQAGLSNVRFLASLSTRSWDGSSSSLYLNPVPSWARSRLWLVPAAC